MTRVMFGRRYRPLLALVAVAGCTDIQLGAANLIETVAVPRTEVAYGGGPRQRMDVYHALDSVGAPLSAPAPVVIFEDFGDNAKVFLMQFWVELDGKNNSLVVGSDLRLMIEKRFGELGIGVPYPQRDLHLMTEKPLKVEIVMPKPEKGDES